jgi:SPP1 gp7 family putative phage head morphogenesis protein
VKIDLAGMVRRAGRTRRSYVLGRPIIPTKAQEQALLVIYMRVVRGWLAEWGERILPEYQRTIADMPAITDSVGSTQGATDEAAAAMTRLRMTLDAQLEDWEVRVETWHRKQFAQSFVPAGVRLDTLLGGGEVKDTLEAVLADNVSLIRSLDDQMRNGISGAVFRGLTNRTPARDVAREIRKVAGIGKTRAELIAADQLQKLTARLDQERQEQVGATKFRWLHSDKKFPRPAHVARDGKVYEWKSAVGRDDPPGRAIRCGCRAQPVLELEPGAGEEAEEAPEPAKAPAPVAAPAAPRGPGQGFRSPVNPDVTASTIAVQGRLAVQKQLRGDFAKAAADERYMATREFRDRTDKDFGNATFSAAFDDEAASMIAAIKPELDDLAEQIGVPRLRGFKSLSGTKAVANQGDGVMAFNPSYFNAYADRVGGRSATGALEEIQAKRAALAEEMRPLVEQLQALRAERNLLPMGDPRYRELSEREYALYKPLAALRKKDEALWKKSRVMQGAAGGGVKKRSDWKPGDDVKDRPFSVGSYFTEGVDQARATMFHEFGHHVHQYLNKQGPRRQYGKPPLERDLITYYRQALHNRIKTQASKYSLTDEHEWFAENFALFVLGRRDLVDETARELIQRIFDGGY